MAKRKRSKKNTGRHWSNDGTYYVQNGVKYYTDRHSVRFDNPTQVATKKHKVIYLKKATASEIDSVAIEIFGPNRNYHDSLS